MFSGDPLDHVLHARLPIENQIDHDENHDHRQDFVEQVTPDVNGDLSSDYGTNHGGKTKIDAIGKGVDSFAPKTRDRKDILNEYSHPVRPVGDCRWQTQKDEHWQGQQRTPTRHDINDSRDESYKGQKEKFDFHEWDLGRKYYFKSNALSFFFREMLLDTASIAPKNQ